MSTHWTTYTICTNYQGRTYNTHYWPQGAGQLADGYVTDYSQFQQNIARRIRDAHLQFIVVSPSGESKRITDTDDLEAAVRHLESDSILSVQALPTVATAPTVESDDESDADRDADSGVASYEESDSSDTDDTDDTDEEVEWNAKPIGHVKTLNNYTRVVRVLDRFCNHEGTCHHCAKTDFSGRRYSYAYSTNYNLCGTCYDKISEEESEDWIDSGLVWESDAPRAPLSRRDDYAVLDEVKHLQYLLTRLGHMKLSDTEVQTGSYQRKTERAVAAFREAYGIYGDDDATVYDKRTASKLARVVRSLRAQGHAYL